MQRTMKAAVVQEFGEPLVIEEVPIPEPGRGEVQVRIQATGVATRICMRPTGTGR